MFTGIGGNTNIDCKQLFIKVHKQAQLFLNEIQTEKRDEKIKTNRKFNNDKNNDKKIM